MYFSKITTLHSPKNSLQTYLKQQVAKLDGLAVEDPAEFHAHLHSLVLRANARYSRCTPVQAYLMKTRVEGDRVAGIHGLVQIELYLQRGVFAPLEAGNPAHSTEAIQSTLFT
ncbi:hypothetical protein [Larkinella sp. C7]|uniref:hypothetical protein n=1 Tax=Larkinella sp. C7 TaxID=2576607 RepID=UPI0011110ADF|nr:hypothetical protein [Larkinella sp. C7]